MCPAADLVVDVAVSEHCVEVLDTFLGVPVVVVLQTFFYRAHVHRGLDDLVVVLQGEGEQVESISLVSHLDKTKKNVRKRLFIFVPFFKHSSSSISSKYTLLVY